MTAAPARAIYATPHLWVQGRPAERLHELLQSAEIHADESGMATLELTFLNWGSSRPDEEGFQLFEGPLSLGAAIGLAFGKDDRQEEAYTVFLGVITSIDGIYKDWCAPQLRVRAEDSLWPLRMTRHTRVFEELTDAGIAERIGAELGLPVEAEVKGPTHRELLAVNQSDLALLRERARAVDAAISVDHRSVQLRARAPSGEPAVPVSRKSVRSLEISADLAHQRTEVQVHGWSVADKDGIHASGTGAAIKAEQGPGVTGVEVLETLGIQALEHHALEFPMSSREAETLAEALLRQRARRFVVARGSMDGDPRIKVGVELEIVDVGPWYTGRYRVTSLRHSYLGGRFETQFVASRPTLGGGL